MNDINWHDLWDDGDQIWKAKTRDGWDVRIYTLRGAELSNEVIGEVLTDTGWETKSWSMDGKFDRKCGDSPMDIVNSPVHPGAGQGDIYEAIRELEHLLSLMSLNTIMEEFKETHFSKFTFIRNALVTARLNELTVKDPELRLIIERIASKWTSNK